MATQKIRERKGLIWIDWYSLMAFVRRSHCRIAAK